MADFSFFSASAVQTKRIAKSLAREVLKSGNRESALILALSGDLGAGKTTFVQGFLREMGVRRKITSPTFTIIKRFKEIYHIDCYRIHKPNELLKLGFKEIISNPKNIVLIEWADRIKKILPRNAIWIKFEHGNNEKERIIKIL